MWSGRSDSFFNISRAGQVALAVAIPKLLQEEWKGIVTFSSQIVPGEGCGKRWANR